MIETTTGQILLPFGGLRVAPELTRERFLASAWAGKGRKLVQNEPYCSFVLPTVQQGGHDFVCSLWFRGPVLQRVSFQCVDPVFGTSWADWSEERERERRDFHDLLLEAALGPEWRRAHFPWGAVSSDYDAKGGFSSVSVTFSA